MPIPRRKITPTERTALELRYDGTIPKDLLGPFYDFPTTREGLNALLVDLAHELYEARQKPWSDAPVAVLEHEMELVRREIAKMEGDA